MSKDINQVILKGRIGNNPSYRVNPSSQKGMATASLYTKMVWKDRVSGDKRESSERHNLVFFNGLAELARDRLKSGSQIFIEGRIQTRKWTDATTKLDRYTTEVIVSDLTMLSGYENAAAASDQEQPAPAASGSVNQPGDEESQDRDIPF